MNKKHHLVALFFCITALGLLFLESCQTGKNLNTYQGKPYSDSIYNAGAQTIPGKLQCEYYDFGGALGCFPLDNGAYPPQSHW